LVPLLPFVPLVPLLPLVPFVPNWPVNTTSHVVNVPEPTLISGAIVILPVAGLYDTICPTK
jgi:hypothetical protein